MRTELVRTDECCMKIILLVITGNFLSGSFRFVGALKSICFSIPSGFAVMSLGTVYLKTLQQFPFLHGNLTVAAPVSQRAAFPFLCLNVAVLPGVCPQTGQAPGAEGAVPAPAWGDALGGTQRDQGRISHSITFSPPPLKKLSFLLFSFFLKHGVVM